MATTPVLALPNFSLPFVLKTDASLNGVGAVLMQQGRPLSYFSKAMGPKFRVLSTYEKELFAIVLAVQKCNYYLLGHHFIIHTDQQSIKYFWSKECQLCLNKSGLPNF